jgi:hypothetical protein
MGIVAKKRDAIKTKKNINVDGTVTKDGVVKQAHIRQQNVNAKDVVDKTKIAGAVDKVDKWLDQVFDMYDSNGKYIDNVLNLLERDKHADQLEP